MISGRDAIASVENAMRGVRSDESRLTDVMNSISQALSGLRSDQTGAFKQLAELKLDALLAAPVRGALDRAESQALSIIEDGRRKAEDTKRRRDEAQAVLMACLDDRAKAAEALEAASEALDEGRARTAERLKSEPGWTKLADATAAAEAIADQSDKKADVAEADLAQKRIPYDQDPLFSYLWKEGFGTSAYKGSGFVRMMDGWVAGLCGYHNARPNYAMLNEIPKRLREHARVREDDVGRIRLELERMERNALIADGVEKLERVVAECETKTAAAEKRLTEAQERLKSIDAQLTMESGGRSDPHYLQATDVIARAIAQDDLRRLHAQALSTPTQEDERILERLIAIEKQIAEREAELGKTRETIRELARRRGELELARDEARRQGYDQPHSTFGNDSIIADVITGIVKGAMRSNDLGKVLREGFSRRAPRSDPGFGGGSWPFPDLGSSRSGGSSTRTRRFPSSGSGSSKGGFRTGGRF